MAITFTDISAHKLAEHVRRESEKQQTFLLQLSDALRSLSDETAIRREAIMRLRLFFECAWVFYQESDPSGTAPWLFEHDGPMDLTPEKSLRATSLLAVLANQLKMGDVNIADVATWAEGHPEWVELQAASGISAVLGVSLTRGAEILASVCVCDTSKRQWSEHTVMLMRDVCERIWNATARARAESALAGSEQSLSRSHAWLSAQKEAFEAAINGAPLAVSLGILLDSVRAQTADGRRCAFYIADRHAKTLQHVVGMPHEYARCVEGLVISPESLACELSMASGEPVITPDVLEAPTWNDWTWLARDFNYRSCWSFPVQTSEGALVGSLAMYFPQPREPAPSDCELAAAFTETAAIIISRHRQTDGPAV